MLVRLLEIMDASLEVEEHLHTLYEAWHINPPKQNKIKTWSMSSYTPRAIEMFMTKNSYTK